MLPVEEMERLLTSDDVNVPDEETVVTSLLTWVGHDADTRERHLPSLLAHTRLPLLQPQVSAATVINAFINHMVNVNVNNVNGVACNDEPSDNCYPNL